jgi:hypothetical protein
MCTFNANLAGSINKRDHFNSWSLCKLIADPSVTSKTHDWWNANAFGRKMLESLVEYHINNLDIQMAVMLLCCFASRCFKCDQAACSNICAKRRYTKTGSRSVGQPVRKPVSCLLQFFHTL